jgi:hypothetical protein
MAPSCSRTGSACSSVRSHSRRYTRCRISQRVTSLARSRHVWFTTFRTANRLCGLVFASMRDAGTCQGVHRGAVRMYCQRSRPGERRFGNSGSGRLHQSDRHGWRFRKFLVLCSKRHSAAASRCGDFRNSLRQRRGGGCFRAQSREQPIYGSQPHLRICSAAAPAAPAPALVTSAELSAAVEALPQDPSNSGLLIKGTNFGANETVAVAVEWTAVASTGPHMLAPLSTDWAGSFEVWFTGDNPDGLCPILVAAGQPQPAQFFFVCASGQSSKQTVSASAGPFTCGFG